MNNLICFDMGYLYNKVLVNGKRITPFKSVVGQSKTLRFDDLRIISNEEDHIEVVVRDRRLFVSDLAIKQSDAVDYTLKPDRFNSHAAQAMLNTALALGFLGNETAAVMVSGLPVSHYQLFKDKIKTLLTVENPHYYDVTVNRQRITGKVDIVDVKLIPQPFGVYCNTILDSKGNIMRKDLVGKTVAVVDVGMGTSDIYVVNQFDVNENFTFSSNTAMNYAYSLIANQIEQMFQVVLPLYKIEKIVNTGVFVRSGQEVNMKPVIDWAMETTARQLVVEIHNKWRNTYEIDIVVLAGGGGIRLSPYMLNEFDNISLVEDAQWAVVNGYDKWGRRTWKDGVIPCQEVGISFGQRAAQNG